MVAQFLHLLVGNWFLMDYAGNIACLPEVCNKCSNTLFSSVKAASAIVEKVLLCDGDRKKRAMAALIDLIEVLSYSRSFSPFSSRRCN